uniref:CYRIA/CYRIB Rac1 binding domain-containing protein n=1 Tax=Lotharella globosa TaxID=91324 RepID=A0A6V3J2R0_9EUKA|mmetsp:Transcript_38733/g.74390  ORF Transcript_38733/g.74390 Transcript_38733/m.74390 type:complete len:1301 (-) Transcript_38733:190-4092(-)|eukprot:CAMPEP_0167778818 /NCGR_PEP_ID=MMETSP0111_2-20121227/4467_1 /TAXON_ID=91324 /ORGANISM="Lotharella globosa, Strain CCCM811" /LENGTH=1300 /DNA_ID=CAMNT_0007669169 /DNA_START=45 /DNA_END=3947 /DNA_ORIENTATION=+
MSKLLPDVEKLDHKIAVDTGSPNIEVPNEAVTYESGWKSVQYLSAKAFNTQFGKEDFSGELKEFSKVWELLKEGEKLVAMLYTFRSCSQALKDVQTTADTPHEIKMEIYHTEFKIFSPEIQKLVNLMNFHEKAVDMFRNLIVSLTQAERKKEVHSQLKLDLIVKLLDLLIKLDKLKDMKSNLVNDFARYKRALALIGNELGNKKELEASVFALQSFLCNAQHPHGLIIWSAKKKLEDVPDAIEVICMLLGHCREALEKRRYLCPDEKHMLHRVIVYLMYILDAEKDNSRGINAFKERRATFVMGLFKQAPVIPLFGDMQIQIKYDLDRCQNWTVQSREQIDDTSDRVRRNYMIDNMKRQKIRADYSAYVSKFCTLINSIRAIRSTPNFSEKIKMPLCAKTYHTVLEGLHLISEWNRAIRMQSAYKCAHPLDEKEYKSKGGQGGKGHEYERVVRYAYNQNELSTLVDVIGMLKGLGSLLQKSETIFIDLCWRYIHDVMQHFVHAMLTRPMRKAFKAHRSQVLRIMQTMREICADNIPGAEMTDDYKQVKKEILEIEYKFPNRFTPPTVDQVVLMRRMMNFICSERAEGNKGGFFNKRDLKKEWQEEWLKIYDDSYFFQYVLNFKDSLRQSMDLSFLWYREFYLNMTKQPQFPIDMSMPWILTKFVIQGVQMKENIFYPMEIYNDAAEVALSYLDQRYLFDEIEAEVNLTFDQLLVYLSKEIFKYFKTLAGSILLDHEYAAAYDRFKAGTLRVPVSRYSTLMSQQTVRLLGRVVNLQVLLAQHILESFRKNVSGIVSKFTSGPLSNACETKSFLDNARLAHLLASKHLPLDSFDTILKEMDGRVSLMQGCGKMAAHVAEELNGDILPNWTFCSGTRRFVPSVTSYAEKHTRDIVRVKLPKHYWYGAGYHSPNSQLQAGFKKYFGAEHLHALLDILDIADVPYILNEILSFIERNIGESLMPSMEKVQQVLQKAPIPLPKAYMGPALAYQGLINNNLVKAVQSWPALKSVFFQSLREIGNAFAFIHLIESVLNERNDSRFTQIAFYMAVRPHPPPARGHGDEPPLTPFLVDKKRNSPFYSVVSKTYEKLGGATLMQREIKANMDKAEKYMKSNVEQNASIFAATLRRVSGILETVEVFDGAEPANGVLDTHSGSDFAKVFSVAQFVFCTSPTQMKDGKEVRAGLEEHSILGDGFAWGGCVLVYLLGYSARFEMLDLCNHILNIAASDDTEMMTELGLTADQLRKLQAGKQGMNMASLKTLAMKQFMRNAKYSRSVNAFVFSTIRSYINVNPVNDLRFSPPKPT